ncbi:uncharacterized protein N7515_001007 [Penicillium bovifimosum]|uniref:Uncharacterized protein n=1 Tax=Penicillium bovifimosum TaxID=126998 RepID=A0A9W9HGX5_9EURO|nr:uncharacterized protein N7515_001007 [Penicillium bovifimosum]KAJ5146443.1 hypothetical protein N7515_001007 [Penicillium bovifimosum]
MTHMNEDTKKASIDALEDRLRKRKMDMDIEALRLKVELREVELEKRELNLQDKIENFKKRELIFNTQCFETENDLMVWTAFKRGLLGEPSLRETELEKNGDINALQRYRRDRYIYELDLHGGSDCLEDFLETERQLRETIQRMTRLGEQNKQEFEDLQNRYRYLERQWGKYRSAFSNGPLSRAFDLWRSHPRWYMHPVLREDCAARGGCCSRECGCCLNRSLNLARTHAAGHCTAECGCCRKAEVPGLSEAKELALRDGHPGVETDLPMEFSVPQEGGKGNEPQHLHSEEEMRRIIGEHHIHIEDLDNDYESSDSEGDYAEFTDGEESFEEEHYYSRITQASIWGLMIGSSENPFDLIDETSGSEQTSAQTGDADDGDTDSFGLVGHDGDSMVTDTD